MDSKSLEKLRGTYTLEVLPEAVREANRSLSKEAIDYNQTEEEVLAALQSSPVQNRYNKMMIYKDFILFWQPLDDEGNQHFDGKPSHTAVIETIHDIPIGFGYYNDDPSFEGDAMALGPNEYGVPEVYMNGSHSVSECIDMLHEAIPNMQDIIVDFERMSVDEAREPPQMGGGSEWVESSLSKNGNLISFVISPEGEYKIDFSGELHIFLMAELLGIDDEQISDLQSEVRENTEAFENWIRGFVDSQGLYAHSLGKDTSVSEEFKSIVDEIIERTNPVSVEVEGWENKQSSLSKEADSFNEREFTTEPQIGNDAMLITDEFENVEEGTMGFISGKFRVEGVTYYAFSPSIDPDEQIYVQDYQVEPFSYDDPMEELYTVSKTAGPYIDELNYLRFENDDLGNNHRFVISPEGEIYSWPKDAEDGEFGIALMALMNDGVNFNDLDEFDLYDWTEFRGQDNKDFYVSEGWIFGNSSGGGFIIINDKIGANLAQIETIKEMVYNNNFRSIVFHSQGVRQYFQRKEDFFRYLNAAL